MKYYDSANERSFAVAGMFSLALRLVAGWTYFSAFWRRLILENKLDPDTAGYIGEKFNHFLPNALLIKPGIEYLVSHDQVLWWFMLTFTIVEAVVGLLFMLGLFTRLMSIGVFMLALGILLGAGWLGTTCLDEWQIGVLGIATGFTVFLSGGGKYSLDSFIGNRVGKKYQSIFSWMGSGSLNITDTTMRRIVISGAVFIFGLTLFTNQYFHGGLWGKLHNLSVKPHITITDAKIEDSVLAFTVFRDEGADVYGSFLIGVQVKNQNGSVILQRDGTYLSDMSKDSIENYFVAKVKPGSHSLVIPLGAKARLFFIVPEMSGLPAGTYTVELTDISGLKWQTKIERS